MNHLKPQELSAHQDGMLAGIQRARAEAHLATCAQCRAALERGVGLEHSLGEQLGHDPGEGYFRDFASRVEARIHPAGAPKPTPMAPPGDGFWTWLNTPVGMSWAGAVAVLVVGAGVALITVRAIGPSASRLPLGALERDRFANSAPPVAAPGTPSAPAPSAESTAPTDAQAQPPADQAAAPPAAEGESASGMVAEDRAPDSKSEVAPARAVEVKPGPNGENIIVDRRQSFAPTPAPQTPAADLAGGAPVKVRKPSAQPLAPRSSTDSKDAQAAKELGTTRAETPPGVRLGNAPASGNQRCGAVRDGAGRAIAGAQLMLVETGSSAQSRADGSFCLDLSSAARTLVVMAVGFEAQRVTLDPRDQGPLTLTLRAVSVMGPAPGGTASSAPPAAAGSSRWVQQKGGASGNTSGAAPQDAALDNTRNAPIPVGSTEAFASLSDSVRVLTVKALQFENDAARSQSAEQYKLAGEEWQKVLKRTQDGPAESETRFRIAAAYYRAWQLEPTHGRSVIALEAISSFVLRAPAGPERDQATMWLGHLRWGDSKSSDR